MIHFDIIHVKCRGHNRQYSGRYYQTVSFEHVKKMPQKEKTGPWTHVFVSVEKTYLLKKNELFCIDDKL